jgi:hypothetical protein
VTDRLSLMPVVIGIMRIQNGSGLFTNSGMSRTKRGSNAGAWTLLSIDFKKTPPGL